MPVDEKLFIKMIDRSLSHYYPEAESLCISESEYKHLVQMMMERKKCDPSLDLYEIAEDIVYDYLTRS